MEKEKIPEDVGHERKAYVVRIIGWSLMALAVLVSLGGWLGETLHDAVLRGAFVYLFLLLLFRLAGRRTLGQLTTFDFVLVLIISEAVQPALTGEGGSISQSFMIVVTLIGLDIALTQIKRMSPTMETWMEGRPLVLMRHGKFLPDRAKFAMVDEEEVLASARSNQGVSENQKIKWAVLETDGKISVVPEPG